MKPFVLAATTCFLAAPLAAESQREADAHEHGVGQLNIAVDGGQIAMEFHAPGADIVGFEHPATSDADKIAIANALEQLERPFELFSFPDAAGCAVSEAHAGLEEDTHEDHHDEHHGDHDDHDDHEDHASHDDHDDHADHDDHDHDAHGHDEHDDHADEAQHTEFHAEYLLTCADASAANQITFGYFALFPNAQEVEVQFVSAHGAAAFEVERDGPVLDLTGHH